MRKRLGFTIIEVLIVVVILGVLASLAAPSMRAFMDSQSVKTPASDLYASLVLARSEAIKRNGAVDLVPNAGGNWAQGWQVQAGAVVLHVQNPYPRIQIASSAAGNLTYGSNGRLASSATLFRVTVPGNTQARMRCVSVDASGRPNVRVDSNSEQTACD